MSLRIWIWLLSLSVLWGGSFFFAKIAVGELPPLAVVCACVGLAAVALNIVLIARGQGLFRRSAPWGSFLTMGLLNNVLPFSLLFWGQTQIASGLAAMLKATTPMFTALLAGTASVVMLVGPDFLLGAGAGIYGELACLATALSYAFAGIYGRRFRSMGIALLAAAAGQITASTLLILPIMLIVDPPWMLPAAPSITVRVALAGLAILSTALAYVLFPSCSRRRDQSVARHIPHTCYRDPAGSCFPGRTAGPATLSRHGVYRRRIGLDRRPDGAAPAPGEIAASLHICALWAGLLGCRRTRKSS